MINSLVSFSLLIGTSINFAAWCLITLAIVVMVIYRNNEHFRIRVQSTLKKFRFYERRHLFFNVAGHQGLPIQLEIFEQNLSMRIRTLKEQLVNFIKVRL